MIRDLFFIFMVFLTVAISYTYLVIRKYRRRYIWRRKKIRIPHIVGDYRTGTAEIPRCLLENPDVWIHEFVEIGVGWTILDLDEWTPKMDEEGRIPLEQCPSIKMSDGSIHMVQHIMAALTTLSGYNDELIKPEEYAADLPWKNIK